MLLGHTDVVAAEPDRWRHPPFGGQVHNGYVWGRGALDMKNMVAAELMVFLLLKRRRIDLKRDVIFAATADEEAGKGDHGVGWLLDNHPEQVDAPFVLTEGGGAEFRVGDARFYTCQTGQKGICRFRMVARGQPGHGSRPHPQNAVVRLSEAVASLGRAELPMHPSRTVRAFLDSIAGTQDPLIADRLRRVLEPEHSGGRARVTSACAGDRCEPACVAAKYRFRDHAGCRTEDQRDSNGGFRVGGRQAGAGTDG